jgi:hypothetical protein
LRIGDSELQATEEENIRPRLTFANVVSVIALFVALGGTGLAASQLGKNSVGSKQLKKNAVTTAKVKKEAITAAKVKAGTLTGTQINASTLGTVPSAQQANSLSALEPTHLVGAPGEPQFENGSADFGPAGPNTPSVGFYKDHEGIVHLEGFAKVDTGPGFVSVFTLPPGYRPASSAGLREFEQFNELQTLIGGDGKVLALEKGEAALEGITFRAES